MLNANSFQRVVSAFKREWNVRHASRVSMHEETESPEEIEKLSTISEHYLQNKKLIEAVAEKFGVNPYFVWQPVPFYRYETKYHPLAASITPFRVHRGYPIARNILTRNPAANFFWAADIQEELGLKEGLYVDNIHYSGKMNRILAEQIYNFISSKLDKYRFGGL
jgi:hypothetical protein